jgi:hypothetical protein
MERGGNYVVSCVKSCRFFPLALTKKMELSYEKGMINERHLSACDLREYFVNEIFFFLRNGGGAHYD